MTVPFEGKMGSLTVVFLRLPAKAGIMGYAEQAEHRDPKEDRIQTLIMAFIHLVIKIYVHLQ